MLLFLLTTSVAVAIDHNPLNKSKMKGSHSLGFKVEVFRSPPLVQIDYSEFYLLDPIVLLGSKESVGFKSNLTYYYHLHPKIRLGLGFVGGRDSYRIQVAVTDEFISQPGETIYLFDNRYFHISFLGLDFSINLDLPIGDRSYLNFRTGVSGVFLHNSTKIKEVHIKSPSGNDLDLFAADFKRNENLILAPNIGIGYAFQFSENWRLQLNMNALYSRVNSIETHGNYVFTNGVQNYEGSFEKQFLHAGTSLEVIYTFP